MDNVTHSLVGWALAETGLKGKTRKGLAACILAANMPDIDVFLHAVPWAPLAMHRGFTHSLIGGVLVLPPLLAGLLWLLDAWQRRQGRDFAGMPGMHAGWLLALCYLGALTHPLLDLQNIYAIQLFSPVSARWFHTDGLFIVSPWLLAFLGLGVTLSRRRASRRKVQVGTPAGLALLASGLFIALNIAISQLAFAALEAGPPYAHPDRAFASPPPFAFWQREVIWRKDGRIARGVFDPMHDPFALRSYGEPVADAMDDPLVRRAVASSAALRDFLAWSQLPFARVRRAPCAAEVTIGDARYAKGPVARGFTVTAEVPLPGAGCRAR
ncbi:metal-dependent hydrolase [Novosphingobium sp. 1949]|uniref:Metal-dependent hydrolase n=1 Tax=Novosphingobium organovorum TaxID=2930092 RepID=A0ABT0BCV3_9SPHN|nr:metal-dependent hydrolase [Novosphingobium organovorum]MCJ2182624.1 metal-dependent hydrolase [Novosphingobium organovorum]